MLKVEMTDRYTGQTKIIPIDLEWWGDFVWTEGNFSCDCNRHDFFYPDSNKDVPCGDDRFTISFIEDETGERHKID